MTLEFSRGYEQRIEIVGDEVHMTLIGPEQRERGGSYKPRRMTGDEAVALGVALIQAGGSAGG